MSDRNHLEYNGLEHHRLWGNLAYRRLWYAATVSNFGTMLHVVALPYIAVIWLDATPLDMAALTAAGLVPGVVLGLFAGAWIDRLRRRPILIAADWGRAVVVLTVPIAAWAGNLVMAHLYAVAAVNGLLGFVFGVAHLSYLPTLVEREQLIAANSRLSAGAAVAEGSAFAASGWLIELLTAPLALVIDAITFVLSALFLHGIRRPEPEREPAPAARRSLLREAAEGVRFVLGHPVLLPVVGSTVLCALGFQIIGVVYFLYVYDELAFRPGALGMIFAVGAVSSFVGAIFAGRITSLLRTGPAMIVGLALYGASILVLPLAPGATALGALVLIAQQMGDGAQVLYSVNETSLRQKLSPDDILGRVNACERFASSAAMLLGVGLGGFLGERFGLRATLAAGGSAVLFGALWLSLTPARRER